MSKILFLLALLLGGTATAQEHLIFFDEFNGESMQFNQTHFYSGGWVVTAGSVDVFGPGFNDVYPAQGHFNYVNLGGQTGVGELTLTLPLIGGQTYRAALDLAGNHRDISQDTTTISFGSTTRTYVTSGADPFRLIHLFFAPEISGNYSLSLHSSAGGALLDNVNIYQVPPIPEPAHFAMLLAGLAGIGVVRRGERSA